MKLFSRRILNVLVFVSAVMAIYFQYTQNERGFFILKPLTTIIVILIPAIYGIREEKRYTRFIIAALIFCLIGDVFLLKDSGFIYGLASFLIAHLLFTYSFIKLGGKKSYWIPLLILGLIGTGFYAILYSSLGDLSIPVAVYTAVIVLMCWQGVSLYLWKKKSVFLTIGIAVVLFMVSDSILALEKFKYTFELSTFLVLATYWTSITLLGNSTHYLKAEDCA